MISTIVAMGKNRVIGKNGQLPWHLPTDLQRFKRITMGRPLLMGSRTFDAIGRPLPGRKTIILSRNPQYKAAGCAVAADIESGLRLAGAAKELFICGGEDVYRQTLDLSERIYLTEIDATGDGDAFFPALPPGEFQVLYTELCTDHINYRFSILQRCGNSAPMDLIDETI